MPARIQRQVNITTMRTTFPVLLRTFLILPLLAVAQTTAKQIHDRAIVIDGHADTTQRLLFEKMFDIGVRQ